MEGLPRQFILVAGMPRAGSTLLMNLLGQNPAFHVTATSGIMDLVFQIRNIWDRITEFQTTPNEPAKLRVMRAAFRAYFDDPALTSKSVMFDKSRGWLAHLELAHTLLEKRPKVIVPVRDLRAILSSFEKLWRSASATTQISHEQENYIQFQTLAGRCQYWMRADKLVGIAYSRIEDAIRRGFLSCMHFVPYERLTSDPIQTLKHIYRFIDQPWYEEHNPHHVEQITQEDDTIHQLPNLHTIRHKVEPAPIDWPQILGPEADKWKGPYVWDPHLGPVMSASAPTAAQRSVMG